MEAATDAPAERTVEATVLAFVDTVLRHEDMILRELGNKPLFFPFPFFIILHLSQPPPTPPRSYSIRHRLPPPPLPAPPPPQTNISDRHRRSDVSSDYFNTIVTDAQSEQYTDTNSSSDSFRFDFEKPPRSPI